MKIVSKNLRKTDIEKRLTIPSASLNYFPPLNGKHMVDFHVRDESDRVWKFRICTRKKNKYLKPVLTKGWREFVCSKGLRYGDGVAFYMDKEQAGAVNKKLSIGDRVVFYVDKEEAGTVKYHVEKAVKIFGFVL
ncbi:hypothetical protein CRYUN_Cryun18bG0137300 [Craigia yunnanensis]